MIRDREKSAGSGKDPETIGIQALSYLASEPDLMKRFLDLSGLEVEQLRSEAQKPGFFVGLLDFILAHEPDLIDFAGSAGLDPADVGLARNKIADYTRLSPR